MTSWSVSRVLGAALLGTALIGSALALDARPAAAASLLAAPSDASASATADGTTGTLTGFARVSNGGTASAFASLTDGITLNSPTIDFVFDVGAIGAGVVPPPGGSAQATSIFSMYLLPSGGIDDPSRIPLFTLEVTADQDSAPSYLAYLRGDTVNTVASGSAAPGLLSFVVDLSSDLFDDLFLPPFSLLPLGFLQTFDASCDTGNCFADVGGRLFVGLDGTSAAGFAYPGFLLLVPEPWSVALLLTGLACLVVFRRPRRRVALLRAA